MNCNRHKEKCHIAAVMGITERVSEKKYIERVSRLIELKNRIMGISRE